MNARISYNDPDAPRSRPFKRFTLAGMRWESRGDPNCTTCGDPMSWCGCVPRIIPTDPAHIGGLLFRTTIPPQPKPEPESIAAVPSLPVTVTRAPARPVPRPLGPASLQDALDLLRETRDSWSDAELTKLERLLSAVDAERARGSGEDILRVTIRFMMRIGSRHRRDAF